MNIPSRSDIDIYGSPDEESACDHFLGKTLAQAEQMFRESGEYYQEDLMWMGPVAFAFYLPAALDYLRSDAAAGDDHLVNCLYDIVMFRIDQERFALAIDTVNAMVEYVIGNYDKFRVDTEIYGDVLQKYKSLKHRLADIK